MAAAEAAPHERWHNPALCVLPAATSPGRDGRVQTRDLHGADLLLLTPPARSGQGAWGAGSVGQAGCKASPRPWLALGAASSLALTCLPAPCNLASACPLTVPVSLSAHSHYLYGHMLSAFRD